MHAPPPGDSQAEARLFSRYLLGRDPAPEVSARYADACGALFGDEPDPRDAAVVAFARAHAWSLPFLDAACGLLDPRALLRRKLLLVLALMETVPENADAFLARPSGRPRLVMRLAGQGVVSVAKLAGGLLLLPLARWRA